MTMWHVGDLPFVFSIQKEFGNAGFPELLPFRLGFDVKDGTFVQIYDATVEAMLNKAYSHGSMLSGLMDEGGIGQRYAEDFLNFLCEINPSVRGSNILDVGCGTGYLLSRLKAMGANVFGLEPGRHGEAGAIRYQIPVIRDYFPSARVSSTFDMISAFGLLEHIVDPETMLFKMKEQLADNGWLVLGVPDCEPYLASGDISFLFHEHWNYFTRYSISHLLKRVFGQDPIVKRAGFGGSLYVAIRKCKGTTGDFLGVAQGDRTIEYTTFVALAKARIKHIWSLIEKSWAANEIVGIYVPWRAVNLLSLRPSHIRPGAMRFFDDNPILHNTFYPGFPFPVESREQLVNCPPGRLLIMTSTFSDEIEKQLRREHLAVPIHTWKQLYSQDKE